MELYVKEIPYIDPFQLVAAIPENKNLIFLDSAKSSRINRYSFIAYDPFSIITCQDGKVAIDGNISDKTVSLILSEQINQYSLPVNKYLPFCGGVAGFIGYEFIKYIEPKITFSTNTLNFPDLVMGVFDLVMAFDNISQRCWIYSSGLPEKNEFYRQKRAKERCEQILTIINDRVVSKRIDKLFIDKTQITSNLSYDDYCQSINKVLQYIQAGDIYQANIAQRFSCTLPEKITTLNIYDRLRKKNPAPFAAYLRLNGNFILSASPERFIHVKEGVVTTCPIKGTSKRSTDPNKDRELAQQLYLCEKNRAENLMIVDLMRNDLAKVCETSSIKVPELFAVETFATVHHLVSTIKGQLKKDRNLFDLIAATFPGGSITGAPKIRAIEIINEIEKDARGPYCGNIGYFSFDGTMDTSILIRTLVIKEDILTFHVGGGIVADSRPHDEYLETLIKAEALYYTLTNSAIDLQTYS